MEQQKYPDTASAAQNPRLSQDFPCSLLLVGLDNKFIPPPCLHQAGGGYVLFFLCLFSVWVRSDMDGRPCARHFWKVTVRYWRELQPLHSTPYFLGHDTYWKQVLQLYLNRCCVFHLAIATPWENEMTHALARRHWAPSFQPYHCP